MKMKPKVGNVITATSMVVAVIALTISAVLFVLSANQHHTNATLTVSYVATNVYVEVDAKYQKKLDASPTALTGGPLTFQPTGVSSTGTLSAGNIVLSPNDNYVLFTYSFKNKATVGGYDIAVTLTDTVNRVNTKVYYSYNDTSTAMSTMATTMTTSQTTTAPQNITIPAQQTKYLYVYVEIDDWYFGASYTSDASHFLKFDITSTMTDFENNYQLVEYIESTQTQYIDTGFSPDKNTRVEYKIKFSSEQTLAQCPIIGARIGVVQTTEGNACRFYPVAYSKDVTRFRTTLGNDNTNNNLIINYDIIYTGVFDAKNKSTTINGVNYTFNNTTFRKEVNNNLYIFATSGFTDDLYCSRARMYYCKIYDDDTLVRDFIPCYRKSDGEIGLYDAVNGVFYTNQGTGEFLLPS